jgi:hypothetical protein
MSIEVEKSGILFCRSRSWAVSSTGWLHQERCSWKHKALGEASFSKLWKIPWFHRLSVLLLLLLLGFYCY